MKQVRIEIKSLKCLTFSIQFRFNLDLNLLPEFITVVKDIVKKTPVVFPLQGLYMRFSGKSHDYMSTSYGRDAVHVEFYLWNRDDPYNDASASLAGYQTILQTLVDELSNLFIDYVMNKH